ncbi:Neutral ceramidase [Melia azedarach]|uniref:Neutral ceramidase n=1 Tax=Melia azedarach TaxID=155640 RepID=A0ACC1WT56_MELAZ|nr:Neutral ceramidase [Melia azedarach]
MKQRGHVGMLVVKAKKEIKHSLDRHLLVKHFNHHLRAQVVQIPLTAAAAPVRSFHVPIPDSLNTLSEFMNFMEPALTRNGDYAKAKIGYVPALWFCRNASGETVDDDDFSLFFKRKLDNTSLYNLATIEWELPKEARPGVYRPRHLGLPKRTNDSPNEYYFTGASSAFTEGIK